MGETRVDLQHLLEDLRDAYTGTLEETILTEILANALDSGAATVRLMTNVADATLTVVDDGRGMHRRQLSRYHDVAASTKARGEGIGFAGVGIKLGLLASREVVTETRHGATHVATRWHLASRHRAPWRWIPPPGMTNGRGTAVRLVLTNPLSPLLDPGYLEHAIRHHFAPLLDATFDPVLSQQYPNGVAFDVDGKRVRVAPAHTREAVPVEIRLGRRRKPSAIGFLALHDYALPEDECGVGVSTYGKVIKRGWEWLGLSPTIPNRVNGLVEIPDLAACLTLNKSDVFRTGPRAASYLAYRKALQEVVSRQLAIWGDSRDTTESRPRTERLERDLQRVLDDLVDDFPLLNSLVERRAGGQKRLPLPGRGNELVPGTLFATMTDVVDEASVPPGGTSGSGEPQEPIAPPSQPSIPQTPPSEPENQQNEMPLGRPPVGAFGRVHGRRRPARSALMLRFEARPDDPELGRLVENAIWINEAHPAYLRATESRSLGYHIAVTVALALAPLAVAAADEHAFLTQFLAYWGSSDKELRVAHRRVGRSQ